MATIWSSLKKHINDNNIINTSNTSRKLGKTANMYTNYLYQAGFLEKISRGKYKPLLYLEDNLTVEKVLNYAYEDRKGEVKKLIRKKKLEKLNG